MNRDTKKPPINISEVADGGKQPPQKGPLTYVDTEKVEVGKSKSKMNLTQLAITVGISILLVILIGNFIYITKQDGITLLNNQKVIEGQFETQRNTISSISGKVDNVIENYATKSMLDGYATESDLSDLSDSLEGKIEALVGNGGLDYYLTGTTLSIKPSRDGYYIFEFIFRPKSEGVEEIPNYYSNRHFLKANEWVTNSLPSVIIEKMATYYIYINVLVGAGEAPPEGGSW